MRSDPSTATDDGGFLFYYGAASGSARKALQQLEEPNVIINYATEHNRPWPGVERLFIDSGGYSFAHGVGEYPTSDWEYLDYLAGLEAAYGRAPDVYALRDYPCSPGILEQLDRDVRDQQRMTTERHVSLLEQLEGGDRDDVPGEPMTVVQGWAPHEYLAHIDELRDRGVLLDRVGVGSLVRQSAGPEIREILRAVARALPSRCSIHAFGIKAEVLRYDILHDVLDSADSQSFDYASRMDARARGVSCGWREKAYHYLHQRREIQTLLTRRDEPEDDQLTLAEVVQ